MLHHMFMLNIIYGVFTILYHRINKNIASQKYIPLLPKYLLSLLNRKFIEKSLIAQVGYYFILINYLFNLDLAIN